MDAKENSFETLLKNAIKNGKELLEVLRSEEFETASEMTDRWGQIILSIFTNNLSDEKIEAHRDLVEELLILQDDLTKEAEAARDKLSNLRKEQNEKNKAATAYQSASDTYFE